MCHHIAHHHTSRIIDPTPQVLHTTPPVLSAFLDLFADLVQAASKGTTSHSAAEQQAMQSLSSGVALLAHQVLSSGNRSSSSSSSSSSSAINGYAPAMQAPLAALFRALPGAWYNLLALLQPAPPAAAYSAPGAPAAAPPLPPAAAEAAEAAAAAAAAAAGEAVHCGLAAVLVQLLRWGCTSLAHSRLYLLGGGAAAAGSQLQAGALGWAHATEVLLDAAREAFGAGGLPAEVSAGCVVWDVCTS